MPGFTKLDNPVLEQMLTSDLTKRQLKILLLIIRFSVGCQKSFAVLRKGDFAYAGVSAYCIAGELDKLALRGGDPEGPGKGPSLDQPPAGGVGGGKNRWESWGEPWGEPEEVLQNRQ